MGNSVCGQVQGAKTLDNDATVEGEGDVLLDDGNGPSPSRTALADVRTSSKPNSHIKLRRSPSDFLCGRVCTSETCEALAESSRSQPDACKERLSEYLAACQKGQAPLQCCRTCFADSELFLDPWDQWRYCKWCWVSHPDNVDRVPPSAWKIWPLVMVEVVEVWTESCLEARWDEHRLPGWPPLDPSMFSNGTAPDQLNDKVELSSNVNLLMRTDIVGSHARDMRQENMTLPGEVINGQYEIVEDVGEGSYIESFVAQDLKRGKRVCLKKHKTFMVEALADALILEKRLRKVDPREVFFPRLLDAFYNVVGFTVETLVQGQDCYAKATGDPAFFHDLQNLSWVACGIFSGLVRLEQAGIVHNDLKPDNLMLIEGQHAPKNEKGIRKPSVKIIDFNLARLDRREEPHRNWCFVEGGSGHKGYWPPEMTLGLPITHRRDVWSAALLVCELHCGRRPYVQHQSDTAIIALAQALGLCGLRDGLPSSLLRRSPHDVQKRFTPAFMPLRGHLPLRKNSRGELEALRPVDYGLVQVLGTDWRTAGKGDLEELLRFALVFDPELRPSARDLIERCRYLANARTAAAKPKGGAAKPRY